MTARAFLHRALQDAAPDVEADVDPSEIAGAMFDHLNDRLFDESRSNPEIIHDSDLVAEIVKQYYT